MAEAVIAALDANGVTIEEAWYTNFTGVRVGGAPLIGPGALAAGSAPPADADGVEVTSSKEFDTYIAGIFGIDEWKVQTRGDRARRVSRNGLAERASGHIPAHDHHAALATTRFSRTRWPPQWIPDHDYSSRSARAILATSAGSTGIRTRRIRSACNQGGGTTSWSAQS